MTKIWGGEGMSDEQIVEQNRELLKRARSKLFNDQDKREMVRNILKENPLEPKGKVPKDRFYREVVKRTLPVKEYWNSPPKKYKGTRLQWSVTQKLDAKILEMSKSGKIEAINQFRKKNDYNKDINSLPIPLNS